MILHIGNLDKFIPPYVDFINSEFNQNDHFFFLYGDVDRYPVKQSDNVVVTSSFSGRWGSILHHIRMIPLLLRADKVIIHALFNQNTIRTLALLPWVLKKCYWVIWGGDLYSFRKQKISIKSKVQEKIKTFVIKRVGYLVTYIPGDVELAREWYGATGTYHECIMYLSNVVDAEQSTECYRKEEGGPINILLGNSADPSNNHFEALELLKRFKNENIRIYAPLSYGDKSHAEKVIEFGHKHFGDKFFPLTGFMKLSEYKEFLNSIDIAIFNHQRQQAMGNTITLLGMGKTVFMRSGVSQRRFLKGLGIKLNDVENIELCRITPKDAEENARVIRSYFSRENLIRQLNGVLEE